MTRLSRPSRPSTPRKTVAAWRRRGTWDRILTDLARVAGNGVAGRRVHGDGGPRWARQGSKAPALRLALRGQHDPACLQVNVPCLEEPGCAPSVEHHDRARRRVTDDVGQIPHGPDDAARSFQARGPPA